MRRASSLRATPSTSAVRTSSRQRGERREEPGAGGPRHGRRHRRNALAAVVRGGARLGPNNPLGDSYNYRDFVAYVRDAEELGYESIFLVEHHFTGAGQLSASLNLLSYLAACTTRIRLGTAVVVLPWHNPVLLAEQVATLDVLSGGRVEFGTGEGSAAAELDAFGVDPESFWPRAFADQGLDYEFNVFTAPGYLAADFGAQKIRVNAISAGPIKTLAASGISDFRFILRWNEINAPLRRNITIGEAGNAALFLLSDLGTAVTGEVLHVDAGYNILGLMSVAGASEAADLLAQVKNEKMKARTPGR